LSKKLQLQKKLTNFLTRRWFTTSERSESSGNESLGHKSFCAVAQNARDPSSAFLETRNMPALFNSSRKQSSLLAPFPYEKSPHGGWFF